MQQLKEEFILLILAVGEQCKIPISKIAKDNNINIKIDRLFNYVINNKGENPKGFKTIKQFQEFYEIIKRFEFNYTEDIINTFKEENKMAQAL